MFISEIKHGLYKGKQITTKGLSDKLIVATNIWGTKGIELSPANISNVKLLSPNMETKKQGGITRAIAGGLLVGPVGAVVGTCTAKEVTNVRSYNVLITWIGGETSLAEVSPEYCSKLLFN